MSTCACRFAALGVFVSLGASAMAAAATPTRPAVLPVRPVLVSAPRRVAAPVFRSPAAPVFAGLAVGHAPAPFRALALPFKGRPATHVPSLLPQLGFAALTLPLVARPCTYASHQVLIRTLPSTPFVENGCAARGFDAEGRDLPPLTLVSGHNKNALYGPAYSPNGSDLH